MSCDEQAPVAVHPGAVPDARRVPLGGDLHVLRPVVDQLDRPAGLHGQQSRVERDTGGELLLATEAAARRGLDDPDGVRGSSEGVLEGIDDVVGALHRAGDRDDAVIFPGEHSLRLQVDVLLGPRLVHAFDDARRLRQGALDLAFLDAQVLEDVVVPVLDLVAAWRLPEIEDRRLRIDDRSRWPTAARRRASREGCASSRIGSCRCRTRSAARTGWSSSIRNTRVRARDVAMVDNRELRPVHRIPRIESRECGRGGRDSGRWLPTGSRRPAGRRRTTHVR